MGGFFITFEGIEGSGKTTQAKKLYTYLRKKKLNCILTREPGGTRISEKIRRIILDLGNVDMVSRTELFLYLASRSQHVEEVVRPALFANKIVISDRFSDATVAYQGAGRNLSIETVKYLNRLAAASLTPDLTFLLDLPVRKGLSRVRRTDRIEREEAEFHDKVRKEYLNIAAKEPERVVVLNGTKNSRAIHSRVVEVVEATMRSADEETEDSGHRILSS
jgi:dTMP kinase